MTRIGPTIVVRGEVSSTGDLDVEGRIEGPVWCEGQAVTISPSATIDGDIVGRDITVAGRVTGTLLATDMVELRTTANVQGRIVSPQLILHEGGTFHGEVQPQKLGAALTVARHRRKESSS
ncbi:MAG: polymer-forming cytoskeletal protein [Acidobacteria bacterium]|nr:polymer-forming cytoskeletal protein [Acidobacteriota bacterium]